MRWEKIEIGRLEAELARADADFGRMTSFLAMLSLPAFVKDKKGRFLFLNAAAERLWKIRARDAIGKTKAQIFGDPLMQRDVTDGDRKVLRQAAAGVFIHNAKGRIRHIVLKFPFADSSGDRVIGGILVAFGD